MSKLPLSIFIIARQEGDRLGQTLEAVAGLAAEVIVVDSGSEDDTVAVARAHGARALHHDWKGYGPQKRFAEAQCAQPWLLNLDADEVAPPALVDEIRALFAHGEPACPAYIVPIKEMFPHETRPHRFAYTLFPVRLYRKDAGRYSTSLVHDRVELAAGVSPGRLKNALRHRSVRSLSAAVAKLNEYSDLQVKDLERRGRALAPWRILVEFPIALLKVYFGRRHFLRGFYGVATAVTFAFYRHLRVAKHLERRLLQGRKDSAV